MKLNLEIRKKIVSEWFGFLQSQICEEFERIERAKFKKKTWKKSKNQKDGGGTYAIIKNGSVFDSVGVNLSLIHI